MDQHWWKICFPNKFPLRCHRVWRVLIWTIKCRLWTPFSNDKIFISMRFGGRNYRMIADVSNRSSWGTSWCLMTIHHSCHQQVFCLSHSSQLFHLGLDCSQLILQVSRPFLNVVANYWYAIDLCKKILTIVWLWFFIPSAGAWSINAVSFLIANWINITRQPISILFRATGKLLHGRCPDRRSIIQTIVNFIIHLWFHDRPIKFFLSREVGSADARNLVLAS